MTKHNLGGCGVQPKLKSLRYIGNSYSQETFTNKPMKNIVTSLVNEYLHSTRGAGGGKDCNKRLHMHWA